MKQLAIIAAIVIIGFLSYLYNMGLFGKVSVSEKEIGPFKIACQDYKGPYQQADLVFNKVNKLLISEDGISPAEGIGFFYDDRRNLIPGNFRSKIGYIIEQGDYAKLPEIAKKLEVMDYPATKCVVAEFPMVSSFSTSWGRSKFILRWIYTVKNIILNARLL